MKKDANNIYKMAQIMMIRTMRLSNYESKRCMNVVHNKQVKVLLFLVVERC